MPVIFLSENNSISKKALKNPFSNKTVSLFEVPFKKMRKRSIISFKERISKSSYLFLSEPRLKLIVPEYKADTEVFFNSVIIRTSYDILKTKKLFPCRLVMHNPSKDLVLSALNLFPDIALHGTASLNVSNSIFRETGAAIPVTSGFAETDAVLCDKASVPDICAFAFGYNIKTSEKSFGGDGIKFYPKGDYAELTALLKRPLTLEEAAVLSGYDKKATFNIAF